MDMLKGRRFEALDAFRGLCAVSVCLTHMYFVGSITELEFFIGSGIFVEFFFVLSGFVLTHGYINKVRPNFFSFMMSRFFRLYPLHFLMFGFFIALQTLKLAAYKLGIDFVAQPFTGKTATSEILPNLLLLHAWLPSADNQSFNSPSWSISIEFYLYALLFITISLPREIRTAAWLLISFSAFLFIHNEIQAIGEAPLRGLSCFFGGAAAYLFFTKFSMNSPNFLFGSFIELTLLIFIVLIVQSDWTHRAVVASLLFIITVFHFAFESGAISRIFKFEVFQLLGKLSYSIYMVHFGILYCLGIAASLLEKMFGADIILYKGVHVYFTLGGTVNNNIAVVMIVVLVVIVSRFTYKYVEVKGQKLGSRVVRSKIPKSSDSNPGNPPPA